MVKNISGWQQPTKILALIPNTHSGGLGVTKKAAYEMIKREILKPNSTPIDVMLVDGSKFIRVRP